MDPEEFADRAARLLDAYRGSGDVRDLRAAMEWALDTTAAVPAGHLDRTACLDRLRQVLEAIFEDTGDIAVPSEAVQVARDAVRTGMEDHADLSVLRHRLAALLWPSSRSWWTAKRGRPRN
jgi:hypothetical protein